MANPSGQAGLSRFRDTVTISSPRYGSFDIFNSLSIINDYTRPSEAGFEIGNEGTYNDLINGAVSMGAQFKVLVNDRLRLTGRVEMTNSPFNPDQGAPMKFTVRTKLADATYASAKASTRVSKGTTIKDFILEIFSPLGYTEQDFIFTTDVSRDLMTGVSSSGGISPIPLEEIKEEQLKVNPPETIKAAADRVLRRHGLMLWDSPDGKITIGFPDDEQAPLYDFRMYHGSKRSNQNNVLDATRNRDFSAAATWVGVFGVGGGAGWKKAKVGAVHQVDQVAVFKDDDGKPVFWRPVLIVDEGVKTVEAAEYQAAREATNRSKQIDTWDITVDGLSYWDGNKSIPYGIDTVATVRSTLAGGINGAYLVTNVTMTRDSTNGDTTKLTLLKKGLWIL